MATWPAKTNYATGDVLTAAQMNDIGGELNDLYTTAGKAAGKNKIINGDFYVNQRAFTSTTTNAVYTFDRWQTVLSGGTVTYTPQTFTLGAAPVSGYEGKNYLQIVTSGQTTGNYAAIAQLIESVRTFANQTITVSFWAMAASGTPKINVRARQTFGTGGSPSTAVGTISTAQTISTSWARYSFNITLPSISGKTIGTNGDDYLAIQIIVSDDTTFSSGVGIQNNTFSIWGVQTEAGSTATSFTTATGTIQGELAACQRYYWRTNSASDGSSAFGLGIGSSSTGADIVVKNPVTMRIAPTSLDYAGLRIYDIATATTVTAAVINGAGVDNSRLGITVASGLTQYRPYELIGNSGSSYVGFSAEL